jgi:para-nitrobenzyl esterase
MNRFPVVISLLATIGLGGACESKPASSSASRGADAGGPDSMSSSPLVATDKGPVLGKTAGTTRAFLGIPYAAPPVGTLRWKPPRPPAPWTAAREATVVGPKCPQLVQFDPNHTYDVTASEDCLTLNVWTPAAPASPRPVMVWIHGGGFNNGTGGDPWFDGEKLSESGDVVVVTLNYRLGPLGFLGHAALDAEDPGHPESGNFGIEDQRAALGWVRTNAAAFGGDPAKVTLFGESAGATSVCVHLVSPASDGLFARALSESTVCGSRFETQAIADAQGDTLATALGCTDPANVLACMRAASPKAVVTALPLPAAFQPGSGVRWSPVVGTTNLPTQPAVAFAAGQFSKVPLLIGTNENEGTVFVAAGDVHPADDAAYQIAIGTTYGPWAPQVRAQYPSASFTSPSAALAEALADDHFVCSSRRVVRAVAGAGQSAWLYSFRHAIAPGDLGAFHSSEVAFVFGTKAGGRVLTADELPLSSAMMGYWSRFAATGDPNRADAVAWPVYETASDRNLDLDLTISGNAGLKRANCDFWDAISDSGRAEAP